MRTYLVENISQLSPTATLVTLRVQPGQTPVAFLAGQYAALSFRRTGRPTVVRCFSIVSGPSDQDRLQFGIRTSGAYTRALAAIEPGTPVQVHGAWGSFVLPPNDTSQLVWLAGGIGITPFMSMLREQIARRQPRPVTLIYNAAAADAPFLDELRAISQQQPWFRLYHLTDRLGAEQVSRLVSSLGTTPANYYICGPDGYMKHVFTLLRAARVPQASLHAEAFSQVSGGLAVTATLTRRMYLMSAVALAGGILLAGTSDVRHQLAKATNTAIASDESTVSSATPTPTDAPTPTPLVTASPTPVAVKSTAPAATKTVTVTPVPTAVPTPVTVYKPPVSRSS
jgi:ferredoxin-NADP reductase